MVIRPANIYDIANLCTLAQQFVIENKWDYTFSKENAERSFYNYMFSGETDVFVCDLDGVLVGFALVAIDVDFHNEKMGYVSKFYVCKEHRGKSIGRKLIEYCCEWFDKHGCVTSHATETGNIGENKLFSNLLKKYRYKFCGESLVRELNVKV